MSTSDSGVAAKPRRQFKLTLVLVILLSIISFATSYKGLVILNAESNTDLNTWQNAFVAFIVFTIQATLVVTLLFTIHGHRKITRILALLIYLVAMLFSVFFSYGWWYEVFRAGSYAQEVYKDSIESIRTDAKTFEQAFVHVREVAGELSTYSIKRARDENLYGGTCDENSAPGRGALNYLRNDEAERFDKVATEVGGLQAKVGEHIKALNKLLDTLDLSDGAVSQRERELNDIVTLIGSYKKGAVVSQIRSELESRRGEQRKFLNSVNPKTDERTVVSCQDEEITGKIDALLLAFTELPDTEKVTLFDQGNNRTVMQRSWEVFSSVLTLNNWLYPTGFKPEVKLTSTDYLPMFAGFLIDLFILMLGVIDGLEYGRYYTGRRYSAEDARQLSDFYTRESPESNQLALLQPYVYTGWFSQYLIVPVPQAIQVDRERHLLKVIAWLEAHNKIERFAHDINLEKLPDVMQAFFTDDNTANQWRRIWHFDIYRVKKSMWRELVISHSRHQPEADS